MLKLSNRCVFVFLILQNVTLLFFSNSTAIMIKRWFFSQWCRWLGINNKSAPNRSWTYDLLVTCVCDWKIIFLNFSPGSKFTITSLSLQYLYQMKQRQVLNYSKCSDIREQSKMENWEEKEERMQGRERVCGLNHFKTFIIFAQWTSISFEDLP